MWCAYEYFFRSGSLVNFVMLRFVVLVYSRLGFCHCSFPRSITIQFKTEQWRKVRRKPFWLMCLPLSLPFRSPNQLLASTLLVCSLMKIAVHRDEGKNKFNWKWCSKINAHESQNQYSLLQPQRDYPLITRFKINCKQRKLIEGKAELCVESCFMRNVGNGKVIFGLTAETKRRTTTRKKRKYLFGLDIQSAHRARVEFVCFSVFLWELEQRKNSKLFFKHSFQELISHEKISVRTLEFLCSLRSHARKEKSSVSWALDLILSTSAPLPHTRRGLFSNKLDNRKLKEVLCLRKLKKKNKKMKKFLVHERSDNANSFKSA